MVSYDCIISNTNSDFFSVLVGWRQKSIFEFESMSITLIIKERVRIALVRAGMRYSFELIRSTFLAYVIQNP